MATDEEINAAYERNYQASGVEVFVTDPDNIRGNIVTSCRRRSTGPSASPTGNSATRPSFPPCRSSVS